MRNTLLATAVAAGCLAFAAAHAAPVNTYGIVDKIPAGDGGWDFANVDPVRGVLYVARTDAVMAVDLATRRVTDVLTPAHGSHQALPIDAGRTLVQTDGKTGMTRFIDTASGKVEASIPTGNKPDAAFYDAATHTVLVMSPGNDTITRIDAATRRVTGTMTLAGGLEFAVTNGQGGAFVNLEEAAILAEVDPVAGKVLRRIALPGCVGPTGLARFADGRRLISACANGVAIVLDAVSGKVLASLPIGSDADAVLVDEARGLAFVPCGGTGTLVALSIADPDHVTVAQVIPTQVGAKTGAIDPRDGRIYLPTATMAPPAPGARRGKAVPGTFTILVVAPRS